ncbi:hypothetical protein QTP88_005625 [Uroleucon formosanum]
MQNCEQNLFNNPPSIPSSCNKKILLSKPTVWHRLAGENTWLLVVQNQAITIPCENEIQPIRQQSESYKDVFFELISKGNVENNVSNTLTIKEGNSSYTFQYSISLNCEDYWVIQHYKIKTIKDFPLIER